MIIEGCNRFKKREFSEKRRRCASNAYYGRIFVGGLFEIVTL